MEFASDNTAGAAPQIMAAVTAANAGNAPSYGADATMARVTTMRSPPLSDGLTRP